MSVWLDFEGDVDHDKYYDIELHSGKVEEGCIIVRRYGSPMFSNREGEWGFTLVSQYRESDEQDDEEEAEPDPKQFNISVKSPALAHALTHSKGNIDDMLEGILRTMTGEYESTGQAKDDFGKQRIMHRNHYRKECRERLKRWFAGELI